MMALQRLWNWFDRDCIEAFTEGVFRQLGTRIPLYRDGQLELTACCGCNREVAWYARRCPRCAIRQPGRHDYRWLRRSSRRGQLRVALSAAALGGLFWLDFHPAQAAHLLDALGI
jgi:hypothetical protein